MAALHDRADRQSGVLATLPATQNATAVIKPERFSAHLTVRANETTVPAGLFQISSAGRVVREKTLELWQRPGEGQAGVVANIHSHTVIRLHSLHVPLIQGENGSGDDSQNLDLVGVGVNRIGTV